MKKCMRIVAASLILIVPGVAGPSLSGYDELKSDLDGYRPPVTGSMEITPFPAANSPDEVGAAPLRSNTPQSLEHLRARWADRISEPLPEATDSDRETAYAILKGPFSLSDLESLVQQRNPAIRAAENRFRAAIESFSQVENLDAVLRRYTAFTESVATRVGPMKGRDPVGKSFPFPGLTALKGRIADRAAAEAWEEVEIARREARANARKRYWDLRYLAGAETVTAETVALLRHLDQVATTRYEAGKTSYQDVVRIRIRRAVLEENLKTLRERRRNTTATIAELTDLPPETPVGMASDWPRRDAVPALAPLFESARENRQEIRRLRARIERMELMVEMAETMILPAYTLGLSLPAGRAIRTTGPLAAAESFPTRTAAAMGGGLPKKPWTGANEAYLRATRLRLAALREKLRAVENQTATGVRRAWFDLDRAHREASLYGDSLVELSRTALEVTTRGYESGEISFADVIGAYTTWLDSNLTLTRKTADLGTAWAELDRLVGAPVGPRAIPTKPSTERDPT